MAFVEDGEEWLTTAEVAELCDVRSPASIRSYVARKHPRGNPFPPAERRLDGRTALWRRSTVEAWMSRRMGQGARVDLYHATALE